MPSSSTAGVAVAFSGGVDSSVAAALLLQQGYRVSGAFFRVLPGDADGETEDAQSAARHLGIPLEVVDCADRFEREIIQYFIDEYGRGRTPNPCVRCNPRIKFRLLHEHAASTGAEWVATGHYARRGERSGRHALRRGAFREKDQSYVLAGLTQTALAKCLFPLGALSKEEVRETARGLNLPSADQPESQEVCFIPNDDYRAFLTARMGEPAPGPILSLSGEVLGQHKGLINYTIGQRRGLGISSPRAYYVVRIDTAANVLYIGHEEDMAQEGLEVSSLNWVSVEAQREPFRCIAQIRYLHRGASATVEVRDEGRATVRFDEPQRAVTPGQAAVLYDSEGYVLAGGVIEG